MWDEAQIYLEPVSICLNVIVIVLEGDEASSIIRDDKPGAAVFLRIAARVAGCGEVFHNTRSLELDALAFWVFWKNRYNDITWASCRLKSLALLDNVKVNPPQIGGFTLQGASNKESFSISWQRHETCSILL